MAKAKKPKTPEDQMNFLMDTYRRTALPTPVLLWRTVENTVASWELSEIEFDEVSKIIRTKDFEP